MLVKRLLAAVFTILLALMFTVVTFAHANLSQAQPAPNSELTQSPSEIRLWFTEPLEPEFSRITIYDQQGIPLAGLNSNVDQSDPRQMYIFLPSALGEGVYTVSWRTLSAADGHTTRGSYSFGIGTAVTALDSLSAAADETSVASIAVRWLNLTSLALLFGSICFYTMILKPRETGFRTTWLYRWIWFAWILAGVSAVAMGIYQSFAANTEPINLMLNTRFGTVWLLRVILWLVCGAALLFLPRKAAGITAVLCGAGMLLANSAISHAAAIENPLPPIISDWAHFSAAGLWFGGLAAFFVVLLSHPSGTSTSDVSRMTGRFSNAARAAVLILIVTGVIGVFAQLGDISDLWETQYGQFLMLKLLLFVPVICLAAFNLLVTQRHLRAGEGIWIGRLRWLVLWEAALLMLVLGVTGALTASNTSRESSIDQTSAPIYLAENTADLHIHLEIAPGAVGENLFKLAIYDLISGTLITDASRIRLRFEHLDEALGTSELRPELQSDGSYEAVGSNLSINGRWRIRVTIARPGQFDTVIDFEVEV